MSEEQPVTAALKRAKNWALDVTREGVGRFMDDERQEAADIQWRRDVMNATMAFAEFGADEYRIFELLNKYFNINDIAEAREYIKEGAQIRYPFRRLVDYLLASGFNHDSARDFMEKNLVKEKLRHDPSLANLPPEELKLRVEKPAY